MTTASANQTPQAEEVLNLNSPLNFNNFNVEDIDMGETVNITILIDNSGSMSPYRTILNDEINLMVNKFKKIHQAPKIFLSMGTFGSKVNVLTGFQPIANVNVPDFNPNEGETRLFDGCKEFMINIVKQQQDAMRSGVQTKNLFLVITDGVDNASNYDSASEVKKMISHLLTDERTIGSFGAMMCGIGDEQPFKDAQVAMGMQKLFVVDNTKTQKEIEKELIKAIGIFSASISSASSSPGQSVTF
jgi:uncharacterized protein YegL